MGRFRTKSLDFIRSNSELSHKIIAPLFENLNVKVFGYLRIFPDWSYNFLSGSREKEDLTQYHNNFFSLDNSGYVLSRSISETKIGKPLYYIWPTDAKNDALLSLNYESNYWHGFTIYIRQKEYIESFSFSVDREDYKMQNFFINNTGLLLEFCKYYQEKTSHIFEGLDKSYRGKLIIKEKELYQYNVDKKKMISDLGFSIGEDLTARELECLYYLAKGNSVKEIARELGRAPKTIENHVSNIKEKTKLRYKSDLIKLYSLL